MKILINFANDPYKRQQNYNALTGKKHGGFDKIIEYTPKDIDASFAEDNKKVLDYPRGFGYWLWKPYFILKTLQEVNEGDYVCYCDSGSYFVHSIEPLLAVLESDKHDILLFEQPLLNQQFAKKQFVDKLQLHKMDWLFENQVTATFILIKKSVGSVAFFKEFLALCTDEELLMDPVIGDEQLDGFIAHRHDQTILSYLKWKYQLASYRDPSQYGMLPFKYLRYAVNRSGHCYAKFKDYSESRFPIIIHQYRKANLFKTSHRVLFKIKLYVELFISKTVAKF